MKLKHFSTLLLLLCLSMVSAAQVQQEIPVDKSVRIGKLPNGLTYYLRHNNWPEHRAYFYIAQKVGSIQEEESQRGLAHFLEHMAFNGSDNFKGNALIEYLRSIGVEFGSDLNAYTAIDQTVYNIDNVPTNRETALDSCLLILRDWSCGLTLDPKEIDKERGVIHEEWRMRTSASNRMFERNLPKLYPGSKYGLRFPIGLMSVVDNFKYQELRDYYEKWYHPSNQGIIVVGDIDVDKMEEKIKKLFSPITNPENQAPVVAEQVPDTPKPIVIIDKDKEQQVNSVDIMFKHNTLPDSYKSNPEYLVVQYIRGAAMSMLSQRLAEAAQKADCPYVNAGAGYSNYIFAKTKDAFSLSATPKSMDKTAASLQAILVEARKAAEFGFTATEFARYRDQYISALEKTYSNRDKRKSEGFVSSYVNNFLDNDPIPPIEYTYQLMKNVAQNMPLEAVNNVMRDMLPANDSNMVILNFNTEAEGNAYPTESQLLAAVQAARQAKITAFVDNVKNEPLIAHKPKAGTIKKETKNTKLGYTELILSNGVKVLYKKTDFKKDQVSLNGEGLGGTSLYGPADFVNAKVINNVIGISGLGNFSSTELQKALAGKMANADLSFTSRTVNLSGSSTPKDMETMFQLAYLYFTNIKKDTEQYNQLISSLEVALKNRDLSPDVAFSDSIRATYMAHNPRTAPLVLEDLPKISYDRILQIAKEQTATAQGWQFIITGNFDEAQLRQYLCQYIASLPAKAKPKAGKRVVFLQEGVVDNIFKRKMETPKASGTMIWHSEKIPFTLDNAARISMAGDILTMIYTQKIREDASAAYSVGASGTGSKEMGYDEFALYVQCPMKPEKKDVALQIMRDEVPALTNHVDAEMLAKVKAAMLKNLATGEKTNGYWNNVLYNMAKYNLDIHTGMKAAIEGQTPQSISAFVKEFLKAGNRITVVMLPQE